MLPTAAAAQTASVGTVHPRSPGARATVPAVTPSALFGGDDLGRGPRLLLGGLPQELPRRLAVPAVPAVRAVRPGRRHVGEDEPDQVDVEALDEPAHLACLVRVTAVVAHDEHDAVDEPGE